MKNLEVHQFAVSELDSIEKTSIYGGGWWADLKAGFLDTFKKLLEGFSEGFL